jgi:iron complex transport system ATP-binding protein
MAGDGDGGGGLLLRAAGVDFSYGRGAKALDGVSVELRAGRLMGLLGPNGGGKSTLFKCCLGLLEISAGSIELSGRPVSSLGNKERAKELAYVPQDHAAAFPFTVREMVSMGRTPRMGGRPFLTALDREAVDQAMESVGVASLADEDFGRLSGGQRRLALVARALAQEARAVLLDEPTSFLDFKNQIKVWRAVRRLVEGGRGAMICCHDPNHILWFCDEATVLHQGRVLAAGEARRVVASGALETLYGGEAKMASAGGKPFVYPAILEERGF